jgi:hypothetical protein
VTDNKLLERDRDYWKEAFEALLADLEKLRGKVKSDKDYEKLSALIYRHTAGRMLSPVQIASIREAIARRKSENR